MARVASGLIAVAVTLVSACGRPADEAPAVARNPGRSPLAINPALVSLANTSQDMLSPAERDNVVGAAIFRNTCALCHGPGIAGAPRIADRDDWAPRIARTKEVLYEHAISGYRGDTGLMPPKGGNPSLADDEVRAAVDYMVMRAEVGPIRPKRKAS